ncbi:sensor domain-containing protein [Massilia putida]|uniref:sensor domain-containing protein n=1 Tax=Massilia putida TaxID=1141883 RepID=UPI000950BCF6|nr:diguanylate cyclase [Massilia putida]
MMSKTNRQAASANGGLIDVIIETSHDAFIGMDAHGCITHWNAQAEAIFGWKRTEAVGHKLGDLIVPPHLRAAHSEGMERYLATGAEKVLNRRVTLQAQRRSGDLFSVEMTISVYTANAQPSFFAFLHDAQERYATESALLELARTDALTSLPNRRFLYERLQETMNRVQRTKRPVAVMFMDIDHFKSVNDSLGHDIGDLVLQEFGARLKRAVRQVDFVARLGGDEFMVIAEEQAGQDSAGVIARKIIDSMATDFAVNDCDRLHITTSIGIALYEGQALGVDDLIRQADQAMYQAKRSGRNTFRFVHDNRHDSAAQKVIRAPLSNFLVKPQVNRKNPDFIQESLRAIRTHLNMDVAFVSRFTDGKREFLFVDAEAENPPIAPGGADRLEESYCQRVVDGRLPEIMPDAFLNDEALSLPATRLLPVRAHLSVPIVLKSGKIYGTYCCFSYSADQSLNERDRNMMRIFADLIGTMVEEEMVA